MPLPFPFTTTHGTTPRDVQFKIYPPAKTCWREICGFLQKETNLCINAAYYLETVCTPQLHFLAPSHECAIRRQTNKGYSKLSYEPCFLHSQIHGRDVFIRGCWMQSQHINPGIKNISSATIFYLQSRWGIVALVTLTERERQAVKDEQQKKFLELFKKPQLSECAGTPDNCPSRGWGS